jgi:hypothetical protein
MKKLSWILGVSLLLVGFTPTGARAQFGQNNRRDADRVCFYTDNYFQGSEQCYRPGDEVGDLRTRNFSSIRVYGNAMATVYDDRNFNGNSMEVTSEVRDLGQMSLSNGGFGRLGRTTWNDRIGSLRVTSANNGYSGNGRYDDNNGRYDNGRNRNNGRYGNDSRNSGSVCVYEDANYGGRMQCFDSGTNLSDLGRSGSWSDRISSIRINGNGRVVAFLDVGYRGERLVIDHDIPDLGSLRLRNSNRSWDNQISSIEIEQGRNNGRSYTNRR